MTKQKVFLSGLIIILLIFAGPKTIQYFRYNKSEGRVIEIKQGIFGGLHSATTFNYPVIAFKDNNGRDFYYSKDNEVLYSVPKVGDKVTVVYNPGNPSEAWLNEFGSFWFALPNMMIAVLCCIAWYGVISIIFVKPRKKKTGDQKANPRRV